MPDQELPAAARRYEAYSHEAMREEVDTDNDPAAAGEVGGQWAELAGRLRESTDALGALLERSGEAWTGPAAEAMRGVLGQAAGWSADAAELSDALGRSVSAQADIAARARAEMPPPVRYDPAGMIREAAASGNLLNLAGLSAAMHARKAEAEAARQKAVDVMNARDDGLRAAVPEGEFTPPPPLTSVAPEVPPQPGSSRPV
ncbi:WXG100 family type VII secretion target [Amycolatopsis suaedae]|uniref:PPE domain-containing protein n=1 Tax=Amycolatopsis suaedae TaxID=2510978 RepID=A0A4Q7J0H7_9PSEU|nr:PPE domain-containing protein [Amycolatopsis suaedae]RZQ59873.1 PPE domain-containing protein [Amycolatopsis suaedae]